MDWGIPPEEDTAMLLLGPVSYLDCTVFLAVLAPQLLWHVGLVGTVVCALRALPFLLVRMPVDLFYERLVLDRKSRTPWVRRATGFEDLVIRCVRYAFANIPARVGRVLFSRAVALPFFYFRLLRHGHLGCPVHWREYRDRYFRGVWMIKDPQSKPDFVLYYIHGGGFAMGSTYFYLEFLLSWLSALATAGYANPAIFGLEYTLVPDACFPTQLHEAVRAYEHVLAVARDPAIVCVAGDSAGATLVLSMLLHISGGKHSSRSSGSSSSSSRKGSRGVADAGPGVDAGLHKPALALLISPLATIVSPRHENTPSDYLDVEQLNRYGQQFAGGGGSGGRSGNYYDGSTTTIIGMSPTSAEFDHNDPLVSPGSCGDLGWWHRASPSQGFCLVYGAEEVFAPKIEELARMLRKAEVSVEARAEDGMVRAWPVVSLFLASKTQERLRGISRLTEMVIGRIPPPAGNKGEERESATGSGNRNGDGKNCAL